MNLNLHLTYQDKTEKELTAIAADLVAFEERFNMSVTRLDKEAKLTHFFFMAYSVERRTKAIDSKVSFEDWLETIEGVEVKNPK